MQKRHRLLPMLPWLLVGCILFPGRSWSQIPSPQSRIVQRVNESALVTLRGNTHPLAQPPFDRGAAPPDLPMARMLLLLKRSAAQESALQKLMDDQQDRNSPSYQQWLTPDAFGRQFGPSDQDIQTITAWLQSHGFQAVGVGRGRTAIEFSGTAAQVLQAFHTEIHKYIVNGGEHWANASDPQIPEALSPVVAGVVSLHNFPKQPMHHVAGVFSRSRATGQVKALNPDYTLPDPNDCHLSGGNCYLLGPYDFAKIYNVDSLWKESPAIDGAGQSIAIVGVSNINIQDVRDFRNLFGLPANDPQVILNGPDPGLVSGDETEADLDVEWSGAVASGATIKLVVSAPTNSIDGIDLSALYVVENRLAPVLSESFGDCELFLGTSGNAFENAIREQAAAEGITYINSSGDEGSARCDRYSGTTPDPATYGLTVNGLASSPYGVAVGGTDFANFPNITSRTPSPYWGLNNDPNQASVLGYVPETTWNSSCTNAAYVAFNWGNNSEAVCNNSRLTGAVVAVGGGGGKSNCISSDGASVPSCMGGYSKPSWQSAPGMIPDGVRDIPDVSLFASAGFMDSAYIVCEADKLSVSSCNLNGLNSTFLGVGGTSASAPAFAGMMALVNQFTNSAGQGNANYVLYKLASSQTQRGSNCNASGTPASGCIFNDVTSGTIAMACASGSPDCTVSNPGDSYGVLSGYNAGVGYDLATGLGSVNAYNLVHNWNLSATPTTTALSINNGKPVNITHGQTMPLNVSVTPAAATGDISLIGSPGGSGSIAMGDLTLVNGSASGTTATLAGGNSYAVKAHYAGDGVYAPSDSSPVNVTVAPEPSKPLITIPVFDATTGQETGNTPTSVPYGSPYIERVDIGNASATVTFPPKLICVPLACPTGSVTLMDSMNGGTPVPLGAAGGFSLNAQGSGEYQSIQLLGGTHLLSASYGGDNSYLASAGSYSLTVTPAPTTTLAGNPPLPPTISTPFGLSAIIQTKSSGVMPSCNVTFYDGSTPVPGTVTCGGQNGGATYGAFLQPSLGVTTTTLGLHTYTAKFNGDSNYAASTGPALTTTVLSLGTTISLTVDKTTVQYGSNVTLTAIVDTFQAQGPAISNAVSFHGVGANPIAGTVIYTPIRDATGNVALQATLITPLQGSGSYQAIFTGDATYGASGSSLIFITVNIPDFALAPNPANLAITAGQAGTAVITVTPASNSASPVTLSCLGPYIPAGVQCSFAPSTVNLNGGNPATATLTLTTLPPSGSTTVTRDSPRPPNFFSQWNGWQSLGALACLAYLALLAQSRRLQRNPIALGLASACVFGFLISCGTPSGGGGSGGQVSTSLTLTTPSLKEPYQVGAAFTVTIKSTMPITGTVAILDGGVPFNYATAVSGTVSVPFGGMLPGVHVITAQYSGDANNLPSQTSGSINQVITGTTQMYVQGETGAVTHPSTLSLTIQ